VEEGSIIPGQSFVGNWELPGGGVRDWGEVSYPLLARELEREVFEELEIKIVLDHMPAFYPVAFKGPKGYDLGLVTRLVIPEPAHIKGEFLWVSPTELNQLAAEFVPAKKDPPIEGKGLLSGTGKRMHCMALTAFASTIYAGTNQYAIEANRTLEEIQKAW
jgi:hypothetical protein